MRKSHCLPAALSLILFFLIPVSASASDAAFTNSIGMEFVRIQPGTFMMGSPPDERFRNPSEKQHEVTIAESFYMQTTEVTQAQWWAVMGKNWLFPRQGPGNMPVTEVSWHNCQAFIDKLNEREDATYRLPTEAQWEYACRAGTRTVYSWGNDIECADAMFANSPVKTDQCIPAARSLGFSPGKPAPVKSYDSNPWGLYDMHGNVWEWCRDCFTEYPKTKTRPNADCSRRVRRGGSWYSNAHNLRSANRAYAHPAAKFKTTGFRVIKEAQ